MPAVPYTAENDPQRDAAAPVRPSRRRGATALSPSRLPAARRCACDRRGGERDCDPSRLEVGAPDDEHAREAERTHDPASDRITPTEVNSVTALRLFGVLRQAAESVRQFGAAAQDMTRASERLQTIVFLRMLLPSGAGDHEGRVPPDEGVHSLTPIKTAAPIRVSGWRAAILEGAA
jgi:hypothetical protein